jgi:hypothetical protein
MPTSKKPRKKAGPPRVSAADTLMSQLTAAMMDSDLDGFDTAYDALAALASRDPSIDAAIFDDLDAMRTGIVADIDAQVRIDAALWAGDLDRAEQLEIANFGAEGFDEDEDFDEDVDELEPPLANPDPWEGLATGEPGALDQVLASGADVNAHLGPDPRPALFAALEAPNRSAAHVERLLSAGADALALTEDGGDSAMVWALISTHMKQFDPASEGRIFDLLLQRGADPDEGCGEFGCILNRAIIMGLAAHVRALLRAGAATDTPTPYDFAIHDLAYAPSLVLAAPKPDVLTLLLEAGANPLAIGSFGQTALDFVTAAAADARDRQTADDPWTITHAAALTRSAELLQAWVNHRSALRN